MTFYELVPEPVWASFFYLAFLGVVIGAIRRRRNLRAAATRQGATDADREALRKHQREAPFGLVGLAMILVFFTLLLVW